MTEGDHAYNLNVTEPLTRDRIIELLRELPADATVDDAIEKLVLVARIERGLAALDASQGVDDSVEALLRRSMSGDVHFERGVPVFPRRPGAPTLTVEEVDRLANGE